MQLVQTVAPTSEPLTLDEAKEFLRVIDNDSDTLISSLVVAVREHVENVTNRQLMTATYELYTNIFLTKLPKNPIQSISKIEYMDEDGVYQVLDNSLYYLYEDKGVGCISYESLPLIKEHKKAVKITLITGYTTVPEAIKQYMRVKISTLFENREQFVIGASISNFNDNLADGLLSPYRIRP